MNQTFKNLFIKSFALLILASMLLAFSGCSQMFIEVCEDRITDYTYEFMDALANTPDTAWEEYSDNQIDIPSLSEEQSELVHEELSLLGKNFKIKKLKVSKDRKAATLALTLNNIFVPSKDVLYTGKKDDIEKLIDKSREDDILIILDVVRQDGGWIFEDLSELADLIYTPYENVYFLGADGLPENVTDEYIKQYSKDNIVDCIWYDPVMRTPLSQNEIEPTKYLQCVFYFNKPQNLNVEAVLLKEGQEVMRIKMPLDNKVIANCDFGYDLQNKTFDEGNYEVILYVKNMVLAQSPIIRVK